MTIGRSVRELFLENPSRGLHQPPVPVRVKHFLNAKMDQNKIKKIMVKSQKWRWKVNVFDMFYVITQPFLKISTSNLYTYLSAIDILHIFRFLLKILIFSETNWKRKNNTLEMFRALQWSGNPYGNGYGVEMEWKWGTICENRMDWIGFGAECRLKTIWQISNLHKTW